MLRAGSFVGRLHQITDALLIALILSLAHALLPLLASWWPAGIPRLGLPGTLPSTTHHYPWLYLIISPLCPLLLASDRYYDQSPDRHRRQTLWILAKNVGLCALLSLGALQLLGGPGPSPPVLLLLTLSSVAALYARDATAQAWLRRQAARGRNRRAIVLVGSGESNAEFEVLLRAQATWGIDIVARLDSTAQPLQQLPDILCAHPVECVIFTTAQPSSTEVAKAVMACETVGVEAWLVADFVTPSVARATVEHFQGRPLLVVRTGPEVSWQMAAKRLVDLLGATLGLLVLGPLVMLPIAVAVKLSSPGPVLFRQRRSGLRGRPFTMYKFRSMVSNAETLRVTLEASNEVSGPVFKIRRDPRVTPFGRFLRRTSLDELPQLWCVLKGEMSLVGPRPPLPSEVDRYDPWHRRRLSMKPGLTCLWQVNGRSNVAFEQWMRLDLQYIDNWSLWLDLRILLRTVPAVLTGAGAR